MTKLPAETWDVKPRLDLGTYERNDICPITGQVDDLEDHHIWRKSFTALGAKKNQLLYWVELAGGPVERPELSEGQVYPNRVWIARDVHRVITEGSGRIFLQLEGEYAGTFWYEDAECEPFPLNPQPGPQGVTVSPSPEKNLEHRHGPGVAPGEECPACHRKVPKPRELRETTRKGTWTIKVPKFTAETYDRPRKERSLFEEDGAEILDDKIQALRERLYRMRGWQADVPNYFVLVAALEIAELALRDFEEGVDT